MTKAAELKVNIDSDTCDQGQTPGHKGFLLSPEEALEMVEKDIRNREVIKPYLIGEDILSEKPPQPSRYVIDFAPRDRFASQAYRAPFQQVERLVLADRESKSEKEEHRNKEVLEEDSDAAVNKHHKTFLERWWKLAYSRQDLLRKIGALSRYVCCSRVTKRPVFVFVSSKVNPSDATTVFTFEDDYSFGILQSGIHWLWFIERCSTLTERPPLYKQYRLRQLSLAPGSNTVSDPRSRESST